jgi:hypothetical protein
MEQLIQPDDEPLPCLGQQHDFNQTEGTDAQALAALQSVIKDPALFTRQLLGFVERTDQDVGVEEKSRIQMTETSIAPQRIPEFRSIEIHDISDYFALPCQDTDWRSPRCLLRRGDRRYRPSTLGHRNRTALLFDFIEQRQAFGLELGSTDDPVLHTLIISHSDMVI